MFATRHVHIEREYNALGYGTTSVNSSSIYETGNRVEHSLQLRDLQFLALEAAIAEVEEVESLVERVLLVLRLKLKGNFKTET